MEQIQIENTCIGFFLGFLPFSFLRRHCDVEQHGSLGLH